MAALPATSPVFSILIQFARYFPPQSSGQIALLTALAVSNRVYLYAMAITIVALASIRGTSDQPRLGNRLLSLTEELLYRPALNASMTESPVEETKPGLIGSLSESGLVDSMDEMPEQSQALLLALLVSSLLALSVLLVPFWNGIQVQTLSDGNPSQILPFINQLWNFGVLTLFTRSEVRRLLQELNLSLFSAAELLEWTFAGGIVGLAFLIPSIWPAQNFVNMALAILVARAIQLNKFPSIVLALSLLALYDTASVLLLPAANAVSDVISNALTTTTTAVAGDGGGSIPPEATRSAMGSVALQKLTSNTFQPGLLVTKVNDRLVGSLGLGDAVFPSLLATFVRRFDDTKQQQQQSTSEQRIPLWPVAILGYALGCLACEFTPALSSTGVPALLLIIPSMLGLVLLVAAVTGELRNLWIFDPKQS